MSPTDQQVTDALRGVIDPEMGIDIVSLGLIYDVCIDGGHVGIRMTLTLPGCPLHDSILGAVKLVLLDLDDVDDVDVALVWDPPWSPEMISAQAQAGWPEVPLN